MPQPMTESELAKASVEIDHGKTQFWPTAESISSQERVTVGGAVGFAYHITGAMSGTTKVDLDAYILFQDKTELFLNCQWIPADKTQVLGGCEAVKSSLVIA
ncbi:MAG TPA: hypothetical protein VHK65_03320 [Candidatus Dormibacteraeota bacterium]|nr:hypothetical protein [Candidatus Dormibacteraeota bacterium]